MPLIIRKGTGEREMGVNALNKKNNAVTIVKGIYMASSV
jgi:hypothetical protein